MPSSTKHSQSKTYLQRVISTNKTIGDINRSFGTVVNQNRLNDELRNTIHYLKSELDAECSKSKQTHRDKVAEIKRMRDELELDYQVNLEAATIKMNSFKEIEIRKLRDSLSRDKEQEVKQIIKYKDEEIRTLQRTMLEEKERALKEAEDRFSKQLSAKYKHYTSDEVVDKLKQEISVLKRTKEAIDISCQQYLTQLNEKNDIVKSMKIEHERELQRVLREARRENSRNLSELQQLRKSLSDKTTEANKLSAFADRVAEEKEELLSERIKQDRSNISLERSLLTMNTMNASSGLNLSSRVSQENELQKKNTVLQKQLEMSTKMIKQLENEISNLTLSSIGISSEAISATSEKKIRELKRKNAELVQIAKKLEDKAKNVQTELVITKEQFNDSKSSTENVMALKKGIAIQRAKDLAKHANLIALKDREIEELKHSFNVSNHEEQLMYKKMEGSLQVAARERLRLERQLSASPTNKSNEELAELRNELAEASRKHACTLDELQKLHETCGSVNTEYNAKIQEFNTLQKEFTDVGAELETLKRQHEVCAINMSIIEEKSSQLDCLSDDLKNKEEECVALSKSLLNKDQEMNLLRKQMKEKELECKELIKTSDMLKSNVRILEDNLKGLKKQLQAMDKLRREYSDLENELHEANDRCESMLLNINRLEEDISTLKKEAKEQKDKICSLEKTNTLLTKKLQSKDDAINRMKSEMAELSRSHDKTILSMQDKLTNYEWNIKNIQSKSLKTSWTQVASVVCKTVGMQTEEFRYQPKSSTAQNSLMDDVFEDTLALPSILKKRDSPSSMWSDAGLSELSIRSENLLDVAGERIRQLVDSDISATESISEKKPLVFGVKNDAQQTDDEDEHIEDFEYQRNRIEQLANERSENYFCSALNQGSESKHAYRHDNQQCAQQCSKLIDNLETIDVKGEVAYSSKRNEDTKEIKGEATSLGTVKNVDETPSEISVLFQQYMENCESLNPIKLFKSNFTYDPLLYSPNDDAHLELALLAGMYIYVYGEMDEDGFYLAELQTGKRGLVPSNLIEFVSDNSWETNQDGDFVDEDFSEAKSALLRKIDAWKKLKKELQPQDAPIAAEYLSITEAIKSSQSSLIPKADCLLFESETEELSQSLEDVFVCSPRNIRIERQMNNSVVIAWKAPEELHDIKGYAIYVNGILKQNVLGSARTKAWVSEILPDQTYRISVHTVKYDGTESKDEQAVLTVGRGTAFAPYDLAVSKLTSTSAKLTWKPSSSSHYHVIYLNNKEMSRLQPGCHTFTLSELSPNSVYAVKIQSRENLQKETTSEWVTVANFKTLVGHTPEPPLNVQCHIKHGYLHVSWIPVTINESGTSNGSIVTGYTIYLNGTEKGWIKSPTEDFTVITLSKEILRTEKYLSVSVRTQSSGGESENSNQVTLDLNQWENKNFEVETDKVLTSNSKESESNNHATNKTNSISSNTQLVEIEAIGKPSSNDRPSRVLLDIDDGDLWLPDDDDYLDNDNADDKISIQDLKVKVERIVLSDDDLSVIEEESENEILSSERTKAERTENAEAGSGGTLFDLSSDNRIFNSDKSDQKNRTVILSEGRKLNDNDDVSITETIECDEDSRSSEINPDSGSSYNPLNESLDTESLRLNKLKEEVLKDSYSLLGGEAKSPIFVGESMEDENDKTTDDDDSSRTPRQCSEVRASDMKDELRVVTSPNEIIETRGLAGQTYSVHKSSSVDENHNKTFSVQSHKDQPLSRFPKHDTVVSSVQIDSVDLVEMLERDAQRDFAPPEQDAHRDILEEYPELPLDQEQMEKQVSETSKDMAGNVSGNVTTESAGDDDTLSSGEQNDTDSLVFTNKRPSIEIQQDETKGFVISDTKSYPGTNYQEPLLTDFTPTEQDTSDIDEDSIESGSEVLPLSSLQLSSIAESRDADLTNQMSSIQVSESDDINIGQSNADVYEVPKLTQVVISDGTKTFSESKPPESYLKRNRAIDDVKHIDRFEDVGETEKQHFALDSITSESSETVHSESFGDMKNHRANDLASQSIEISTADLPSDGVSDLKDHHDKDFDSISLQISAADLPLDKVRDKTLHVDKNTDLKSIDSSAHDLPSGNDDKPSRVAPSQLSRDLSKDSLDSAEVVSSRQSDALANRGTERRAVLRNEADKVYLPIVPTPTLKKLLDRGDSLSEDERSLSRSAKRSLTFDDDDVVNLLQNTEDDDVISLSKHTEGNDSEPITATCFLNSPNSRLGVRENNIETVLPSDFTLAERTQDNKASETVLFAQSNSDTEYSESCVILKPIQNIYALGAHVDVSASERSVTEKDLSDITDEENEFDVTPINALDVSLESNLDSPSVNRNDSVDHVPVLTVKDMVGKIEDSYPAIDSRPAVAKEIEKQTNVRIFIALYPYNPLTMSPNVDYVDDELAFEEGALLKIYGEIDEDGFYFGELDGVTGLVPGNMVSELNLSKENTFQDLASEKIVEDSHSENPNKTDSFDVSFMVERRQKDPSIATSIGKLATASSSTVTKTTSNLLSNKSLSQHNVNKENTTTSSHRKSVSMPDVYLQGSATNQMFDPYKFKPRTMVALFDYDPISASPNVDAEIELAFRSGEIIHVFGEMDEDGFYAGEKNGNRGLVPSNFVREATLQDRQASGATEGFKAKKKNSFFKKSKKIFSLLKGGK